MSKQVITDMTNMGEDVIVREDTAKAHRGVYWALGSIALILFTMVVLFFGGFLKLASDGNLNKTPADIEREARN